MKFKLKVSILIFLFIQVSICLIAQKGFSIHLGPSIPMADFGSYDFEDLDSHGAEIGIDFGCKYVYPLTESGLGIFCGADFTFNGTKDKYKDALKSYLNELGFEDDEVVYLKYSNYFSLPISAGLSFSANTEGKIDWFSSTGLSASFLKRTELVSEVFGFEQKVKFDITYNTGYYFGIGIIYNDRFSLAINYFGLGEFNINSTASTSEDNGEPETDEAIVELDVDFMTITIGYTF